MIADDCVREVREVREVPFRLRVTAAFVLTGRGTTVIGCIEQGTVRVGDQLRLVRGDGGPISRAQHIYSVRIADWQPSDAAPVGLLLPDLEAAEIRANDVLVAFREGVDS